MVVASVGRYQCGHMEMSRHPHVGHVGVGVGVDDDDDDDGVGVGVGVVRVGVGGCVVCVRHYTGPRKVARHEVADGPIGLCPTAHLLLRARLCVPKKWVGRWWCGWRG